MNRNLVLRILTALIGGSAAVGVIYYHPLGLWLFGLIISMLGLWEFLGLMGLGSRSLRIPLMLFGLGTWMIVLFEILLDDLMMLSPQNYFLLGILILPFMALISLFRKEETEPLPKLGIMLLGLVYCFLPLVLYYKLSVGPILEEYDPMLPLGILFLNWILDTGAYFSGRWFGKHKLFERISPKKTWEGSIGGALLCLGLAAILQHYHAPEHYSWWIIAAIIIPFSQFGDLVESMFKRSISLKDSGSILPGHGGILDRFDGMYLSLPFIFFYFSVL